MSSGFFGLKKRVNFGTTVPLLPWEVMMNTVEQIACQDELRDLLGHDKLQWLPVTKDTYRKELVAPWLRVITEGVAKGKAEVTIDSLFRTAGVESMQRSAATHVRAQVNAPNTPVAVALRRRQRTPTGPHLLAWADCADQVVLALNNSFRDEWRDLTLAPMQLKNYKENVPSPMISYFEIDMKLKQSRTHEPIHEFVAAEERGRSSSPINPNDSYVNSARWVADMYSLFYQQYLYCSSMVNEVGADDLNKIRMRTDVLVEKFHELLFMNRSLSPGYEFGHGVAEVGPDCVPATKSPLKRAPISQLAGSPASKKSRGGGVKPICPLNRLDLNDVLRKAAEGLKEAKDFIDDVKETPELEVAAVGQKLTRQQQSRNFARQVLHQEKSLTYNMKDYGSIPDRPPSNLSKMTMPVLPVRQGPELALVQPTLDKLKKTRMTQFEELDVVYRYAILKELAFELGIHAYLCAVDGRYVPQLDLMDEDSSRDFLFQVKTLHAQQARISHQNKIVITAPKKGPPLELRNRDTAGVEKAALTVVDITELGLNEKQKENPSLARYRAEAGINSLFEARQTAQTAQPTRVSSSISSSISSSLSSSDNEPPQAVAGVVARQLSSFEDEVPDETRGGLSLPRAISSQEEERGLDDVTLSSRDMALGLSGAAISLDSDEGSFRHFGIIDDRCSTELEVEPSEENPSALLEGVDGGQEDPPEETVTEGSNESAWVEWKLHSLQRERGNEH